jgi:hypothetical protein
MNLRKMLFVGMMTLTGCVIAQTNYSNLPTQVNTIHDKSRGKLDLEFKNDKLVDNLLVILTDSAGQTVFLENLYRYQGIYKKNIELPYKGKGFVTLHINKDDERIIKKLTLK